MSEPEAVVIIRPFVRRFLSELRADVFPLTDHELMAVRAVCDLSQLDNSKKPGGKPA